MSEKKGVILLRQKNKIMKNVSSFLIGSLSSLGVAMMIPGTVMAAAEVPASIVNSLEALISLVSGLLSAILVAWIKKKWDKK